MGYKSFKILQIGRILSFEPRDWLRLRGIGS